jgi:T-complex protein 1 subunit eta
MSYMMRPPIILLKDGTDSSQGIPQLISNINACGAIFDILKTTLGPAGMDKLIHQGNSVTISNDGATIIKLLDIVHPAARTLVDIARSQDAEVGDGTTSVVLLAAEFLNSVKGFIEDGVHPQVIIHAFREANNVAMEKLRQMKVDVDQKDEVKFRELLRHCAGTAMNSKLICGQKEFFSDIVVDAVLHLEDDLDLKNVGIKKVPGGSVTDSFLVEGVAFKKTFAYAGFEQQPKRLENPKIVLLNVELELKSEKENAEIRITDPDQYQSIVDAEWSIIYSKLDKIVESGANIVLSSLPIGDLATQYFADRNIFCAGRVEKNDMHRVAKATSAITQTSLNDLSEDILGTSTLFEERQVGGERYNLFTGCPNTKTATIVIRGGANQYIEETERSLHDAIMVVRRTRKHNSVVAGGGAIEMELSKTLREHAKGIQSKVQLIINAYAKALEVIPRQLAANAGHDPTDIVNDLRAKHATGNQWFGVDIENGSVCDTFEKFVWEPALLKQNALSAATQAACMILSVDETVNNAKSKGVEDDRPVPVPGRGRRR